MRKVVLYISMSLDGYLATEDDGLDFLSMVEKEGEDYGYQTFMESVDTYIVGRKTYDIVNALTNNNFPHAQHLNCYVITRQKLPAKDGITFYNGNLSTLIEDLRAQPGKNIYCDGGAQIVKLLLENGLIDDLIISIIPTLLGKGKRLFIDGNPKFSALKLINATTFETGLVQLHYQKLEDK